VLLVATGFYISKNKPTAITYLFPSISVLEMYRKKTNHSHLEKHAHTVVPYGLYGLYVLYGFLEIRAQNLLLLYGGRTDCNFFFFFRFACCGVCNRYRNLCCIKSVPYELINAAGFLDLCAQLCLENRASSLLPFPLQKIETLLLFLLSLNLSISHGKNEFVFGLFPPLESLSDS
jgi:hypothetical protein